MKRSPPASISEASAPRSGSAEPDDARVAHPRTSGLRQLALLLLLAGSASATSAAAPVRDVTVDGVEAAVARDAIAASGLAELPCDAARWAVNFRAGRLEEALRERLRAKGRFSPRFTRLRDDASSCALRLEVDPGTVVRVRTLRMELTGPGRDALKLPANVSAPKVGDVLNEAVYERYKLALSEHALAEGYLAADFTTQRVDVYPIEGAADIALVLETGERHRLGELVIETEEARLDPELLRRIADFAPGTPYTLANLSAVRQRLQSSGYLESVDLQTRDAGPGVVDVIARLRPRSRRSFTGALGFATDVGPRLELGFDNHYLNRRGHQLGARVRASGVFTELRGEYRLPLDGDDDPWLVLDASRTRERTDTVSADTVGTAVRRVHAGPFGTRMTEFLELTRERYEVANDDERARLLVAGASVARSERLRALPLELGWRTRAEVRGTTAPISTTSFAQLRLDGTLALAAGSQARLLLRGSLGTTVTDSLRQLPASVRFFAGGDRSVRGYGLDDVGALAENGEVRGGRHLVVGSVEYEHVVRGPWSVAAFVDSGRAFNELDDPWSTGVGLGVRWRSPLGPISVDVAIPLDDPDRNLRLHVGIGNLFQ